MVSLMIGPSAWPNRFTCSAAVVAIAECSSVPGVNNDRINTAATGPIVHNPTNPNESSSAVLLERMAATPIPMAIMNGTTNGPVAIPPESNAIATCSGRAIAARTNNIVKLMMRMT